MPYDDHANYRGPYNDQSHINTMDYNSDARSSFNQTPPYPYPSQYGPDRTNMPQPPPPQMMPPNTSSPSSQRPDMYHGGSDGSSWYKQPQTMPPNTSSPSSQRPDMYHGGSDGSSWYQQPQTMPPNTSSPSSQYHGGNDGNPWYQQPQPQPHLQPPNTSSPSAQRPEMYHGGGDGSAWYQQPRPLSTSSPSSQRPDMHHGGNDASSWHQQPHAHTGRINDAVNSAFSDADRPSYLSPDVVSQITANVIQQLKTTGLDNIQGGQQQPQPQQSQQPPPSSGPGLSYSQSPTYPHAGHEDTSNYQSYPAHPTEYQDSPCPVSTDSPVSHPMERHGSRASQGSEPSSKVESRPNYLSREATDPDMTTLEKIWGRLFWGGKPTKRLGQFLRGIAVHLIENYPPGNTLVVTPEKMQRFYEDTAIASDPYPWEDIFDDRTSAISRLLREVEAEHHLVQIRLNERPDVPGLTPRGFERWASLMIQIHPEKEFQRLQKAVLNMPISNPDNKRERFPKELPRRLIPETPDFVLREEVDQFIMEHCAVDLPPITEEEIATTRRNKSYHSPTVEDEEPEEEQGEEQEEAVEEEEEETAPNPIERERKPYSTNPGGDKAYDEPDPPKRAHRFSTSSRPREDSTSSRPGHQLPSYDSHYARTGSAGPPHPTTKTGRSRSPARGAHVGYDYRHSDGDLLGHSSGAPPRHSPAGDPVPDAMVEESRRYRNLEREEDKRLYEAMRERDHREREKNMHYHHSHNPRGARTGEDDYYRRAYGGGPVGGGGSGGYERYAYR